MSARGRRAGSGRRAAPAGERGRRRGPKVASSRARVPGGAGARAGEAAAADPASRGTWAAAPHEQQRRGRRWRRRAGSEPELRRSAAAAGELGSGARRGGRGPELGRRDRDGAALALAGGAPPRTGSQLQLPVPGAR